MPCLFPVGFPGLCTAEGTIGLGTCLLDGFCLKQWPKGKFLILGRNPEFLIKMSCFPHSGLCFKLTLQGDFLLFLQTVSHIVL